MNPATQTLITTRLAAYRGTTEALRRADGFCLWGAVLDIALQTGVLPGARWKEPPQGQSYWRFCYGQEGQQETTIGLPVAAVAPLQAWLGVDRETFTRLCFDLFVANDLGPPDLQALWQAHTETLADTAPDAAREEVR